METRLLILNADPVFQDRSLAILDQFDGTENRVVRSMPEAVSILLGENFDRFVVEGENPIAMDQATSARQHFPSLRIVCLSPKAKEADVAATAQQQKIRRITSDCSERILRKQLHSFVSSLAQGGTPAEGIDPCHSLIGNLNQFSAAEILQMSCLSQRSGRFTFAAQAREYLQLFEELCGARPSRTRAIAPPPGAAEVDTRSAEVIALTPGVER